MKRLSQIFVFIIFSLAASASAEGASLPSKEAVLAAIETLRTDATAPEANAAATTIMDFAHLSDDVDVKLNFRYTPWMRGNIPELVENKLIAAFVGGNIEPQIKEGKVGHRPYEGTVLQIVVYQALRAKGQAPLMRRLEKLIEFQAQGILEEKVR